jgi:hypothetical protein
MTIIKLYAPAIAAFIIGSIAQDASYDVLDYVDPLIGSSNGGWYKRQNRSEHNADRIPR